MKLDPKLIFTFMYFDTVCKNYWRGGWGRKLGEHKCQIFMTDQPTGNSPTI